MRIPSRNQAGDTIVEVIIAVAVVSLLLTGAFIVTNRNMQAVRDSEEHAEALQLLQGQVELLRSAAANSGGLPSGLSTPFCLTSSAFYQPAANNTHCTLDPSGNGVLGGRYQVAISSPTSTPNVGTTTTFNLTTTWDALGGGTDKVFLSYKVEVTP